LIVLKKLEINGYSAPDLSRWKEFLDKLKYPKARITIGLIGKYVELQDAYKSILESFIHAGAVNECKVQVVPIHSEFITPENVAEKLHNLDGLLVAPGFWPPRRGRQDHRRAICPRNRTAVLWYLPWHADGRY
jgi:CTP synthase